MGPKGASLVAASILFGACFPSCSGKREYPSVNTIGEFSPDSPFTQATGLTSIPLPNGTETGKISSAAPRDDGTWIILVNNYSNTLTKGEGSQLTLIFDPTKKLEIQSIDPNTPVTRCIDTPYPEQLAKLKGRKE